MNQTKNRTDHSDYFKLPQSESKVRVISKPVKIAQLLGSSRKLQNIGDSSIKRSLPEKIIPYLKNVSTQKKIEANSFNRSGHSTRNVRRNLNFAGTSNTVTETEKIIRRCMNNANDSPMESKKKICSSRKSLLLPPNTIKDLHIKNTFKQDRIVLSCSNQTRMLTVNSGKKYLRISEVSENSSSLEEKLISQADPIMCEKSKKTSVIQHTSSQIFDVNNQSGINSLHSSCSDLDTNHDDIEKGISKHLNCNQFSHINLCNSQSNGNCLTNRKTQPRTKDNAFTTVNNEPYCVNYINSKSNAACTLPSAVNVPDQSDLMDVQTCFKERYLSTTIQDCEEYPYPSLQKTKPIIESNVDVQHDIIENCNNVTLDKTELSILRSKLRHVIDRIDEDMSELKLILATITNALSPSTTTKIRDNNENIENRQQITEHLRDVKETANNLDVKSLPLNVFVEKNISKDICNKLDIDLLKSPIHEMNGHEIQPLHQIDYISFKNNKENQENLNLPFNTNDSVVAKSKVRRRSERLMAKSLNNLSTADDSFVTLENALNITNVTPDATNAIFQNYTPVTSKYKDKKVEKSLKEYMSLKWRMNCLLTPNVKRFNSSITERNTNAENGRMKARLSTKIFAELQNLYADSPDTK